MKLIIAGGRDFSGLKSFGFIDYIVSRLMRCKWTTPIEEVVCGGATGMRRKMEKLGKPIYEVIFKEK